MTPGFVYHIYPLGLTGAPQRNDFSSPPQARLQQLYGWLDEIQSLGCDALYLGPLFESSAHGYDTADYYHVDRRLGSNADLAAFAGELRRRGLRLILDAVFNHVGRDFWAFRDLQTHGQDSPYRNWFAGLDFSRPSPAGDPFTYTPWAGHYDLVKLNLLNPQVQEHLFGAVRSWVDQFEVDGLRLDAADVIDPAFLRALSTYCRGLRPDFWLMGEMVHGDYRRLSEAGLDSVTNYEVYKSLWSSLNDRNLFELAYALKRQSGAGGIYSGLRLYTFADNHDVDRVASSLKDARDLPLLYALLLTIPGIPSIYYGSERGLRGQRSQWSDRELRPALSPLGGAGGQAGAVPEPGLAGWIRRLADLRRGLPALREGGYQELLVGSRQLAFARGRAGQEALVLLNADVAGFVFDLPAAQGGWQDQLDPAYVCTTGQGRLRVECAPRTLRVLTQTG